MDAKLDERLRAEAFDTSAPKNDFGQRYVHLGKSQSAATASSAPWQARGEGGAHAEIAADCQVSEQGSR